MRREGIVQGRAVELSAAGPEGPRGDGSSRPVVPPLCRSECEEGVGEKSPGWEHHCCKGTAPPPHCLPGCGGVWAYTCVGTHVCGCGGVCGPTRVWEPTCVGVGVCVDPRVSVCVWVWTHECMCLWTRVWVCEPPGVWTHGWVGGGVCGPVGGWVCGPMCVNPRVWVWV